MKELATARQSHASQQLAKPDRKSCEENKKSLVCYTDYADSERPNYIEINL